MEHVLTMANLKFKPSLFTPCPKCTELPFVNQISIILLLSIVGRYDHGHSGICRGVITFLYIPKGGSSII